MKFYFTYRELQLVIETITHIVTVVAPYVIVPSMNWNEIYKITCKLDMSMTTIRITQSHSKTTEILRELRQKYKFTSLFVIILGTCLLLPGVYVIFILHFVKNINTRRTRMQPIYMNHCYYKNILLAAGHHLMKILSGYT